LATVCARCQWHLLPRDYRAFWTVYGYFQAWQRSGAWQAVHDRLRGDLRGLLGRRLSKDFEARPQTSEAWIRIAMIQLMTRHLTALAT
jgi:transposase